MALTYVDVSEVAGDEVSQEQIERLCNRYFWAGDYIAGKDVLEVACGAGFGLSYMAGRAKSVSAGDVSPEMLAIAKKSAPASVELKVQDAAALDCEDNSKDVILCFEAIYYFPSIHAFFEECQRVLRPGFHLPARFCVALGFDSRRYSGKPLDDSDFHRGRHHPVRHCRIGCRTQSRVASGLPVLSRHPRGIANFP